MCIIDITYYPFDEQRCELTFGSWSYNIRKVVRLYLLYLQFSFLYFIHIITCQVPEWDIVVN